MPNKILISQLKKVEASSSFMKKKIRYKMFDNDCDKKIIHIRSKRTGVSDDNSLPWLEHPRDFSDPDCTDPPTNWQPRNTGATISFLNRIFLHDFMIGKKYSLEFQTDTVTVQCSSHCVYLSHSQWPLPVFDARFDSLVVREQTIAPTNKEPVWSKVFRKQLLQTSRPPQPLLKSLNSSAETVQKMQKW